MRFFVASLCAVVIVAAFGGAAHSQTAPAPPAAASPAAASTADAHANVDALVGWPSGADVVQERKWEDQLIAVPTAANAAAIERRLSSMPHRAGSPADYATAQFVSDRLKADGFEVQTVPFSVLYTNPVMQKLAVVSPQARVFDLLEGVPGHHTADEIAAGPSFMENSGDGDVTAPLFYLNHGTPDDWDTFDSLGVTMPPGSIVIERLGGGSRDPMLGQRSWEALKKHGVAGLIVYYDPQDDGVYGGETWPHGNWKNSFMTERIGGPKPGVAAIAPPGDPTLPGQAPLPGIKHLAWEQTEHSDIPEMDVTQAVARALLAGMTGPVVPMDWHGGFEMVEHVGGNERVHLAVKMERKLVTIWQVLGTIEGAKKPNEIVVIGSHRDAMAFGAIDPGSGTTVLLQDADAFKKMHDAGWKPDRTIEIASWDGHELGLWGSISLAYAHQDFLRKHVVQYINTDQLTTGPPYVAAMSPELWAFGDEIASLVKGTDGKPIIAASTPKKPLTVPPGGGSDHMTFIYWLGVPGSTTGYYGHFGAHHSAEDDIAGLQTYDPGYREAVVTAQFTGVQAMRAAGAVEMPLRLTAVPTQLLKDIKAAMAAPQYDGIDLGPLQNDATAYLNAATSFDARLAAAERAGDANALDKLERRAMTARDAFWMPDGLTYNKYWHTIDRFVQPFPELNFAAYETTNRDADVKKALDRLSNAIRKATSAIR